MMCELRKLFLLIDKYDIKIRTQYIRSAANIWPTPSAASLTTPIGRLRIPDENWRREHNWCNPPWELLDDLVVKLR
jgi:hypothetical protein